MYAAPIAPAAGPDSSRRTGNCDAVSGDGSAAVGLHDEQCAGTAIRASRSRSERRYGPTIGRDIGVDRRVDARSYSRISGATSDDSETWMRGRELGDEVAQHALVHRIAKGVQQTDARWPRRLRPGERLNLRVRLRRSSAVSTDPSARMRSPNRSSQATRDDGQRLFDVEVVQVEAVLRADLDGVPEPLGDEQRALAPRRWITALVTSVVPCSTRDDRLLEQTTRADHLLEALATRCLSDHRGRSGPSR